MFNVNTPRAGHDILVSVAHDGAKLDQSLKAVMRNDDKRNPANEYEHDLFNSNDFLGSFGSLWDHGIVITETSHQNMNDDISIS
jgi:hypothetical protein